MQLPVPHHLPQKSWSERAMGKIRLHSFLGLLQVRVEVHGLCSARKFVPLLPSWSIEDFTLQGCEASTRLKYKLVLEEVSSCELLPQHSGLFMKKQETVQVIAKDFIKTGKFWSYRKRRLQLILGHIISRNLQDLAAFHPSSPDTPQENIQGSWIGIPEIHLPGKNA